MVLSRLVLKLSQLQRTFVPLVQLDLGSLSRASSISSSNWVKDVALSLSDEHLSSSYEITTSYRLVVELSREMYCWIVCPGSSTAEGFSLPSHQSDPVRKIDQHSKLTEPFSDEFEGCRSVAFQLTRVLETEYESPTNELASR